MFVVGAYVSVCKVNITAMGVYLKMVTAVVSHFPHFSLFKENRWSYQK